MIVNSSDETVIPGDVDVIVISSDVDVIVISSEAKGRVEKSIRKL